jgi:hypothetical protein
MRQKRYGETIPLRLKKTTAQKVRIIATATGLNSSDVLRLAINAGLPGLEAGNLKFSHA